MNIGQSKTYYTHTVGERLPIDKGPLQAELINDGNVDCYVLEEKFLRNIDQARLLLKRPEIVAGIQQALRIEAQGSRPDLASRIADQVAKATNFEDLEELPYYKVEDPVVCLEESSELFPRWQVASHGHGSKLHLTLKPLSCGPRCRQVLQVEHNGLELCTTKWVDSNVEGTERRTSYHHKISSDWLPGDFPTKTRESLTVDW